MTSLPTAPFFSKTLSSAGSPAFLISPPLPPHSWFTLIDLAARHQNTQFCPSPLNYLDAASYANDVLYRISLFLFSLSLSPGCYMCLHTRQPPAWLDLTHDVFGGWSTLPLHEPSSPCMCGSIKPRLLESDPASSPFTSSKTLQWFPSNSWKTCSRFHCIPLLPSYASLDTTARLIAVQTHDGWFQALDW